jgi:hypothetical protein
VRDALEHVADDGLAAVDADHLGREIGRDVVQLRSCPPRAFLVFAWRRIVIRSRSLPASMFIAGSSRAARSPRCGSSVGMPRTSTATGERLSYHCPISSSIARMTGFGTTV